jgi:hypothetical protein
MKATSTTGREGSADPVKASPATAVMAPKRSLFFLPLYRGSWRNASRFLILRWLVVWPGDDEARNGMAMRWW